MITEGENALIFPQILSTHSFNKSIHLLVFGHTAQLSPDPLVWLAVSLTSACLFSADTKR